MKFFDFKTKYVLRAENWTFLYLKYLRVGHLYVIQCHVGLSNRNLGQMFKFLCFGEFLCTSWADDQDFIFMFFLNQLWHLVIWYSLSVSLVSYLALLNFHVISPWWGVVCSTAAREVDASERHLQSNLADLKDNELESCESCGCCCVCVGAAKKLWLSAVEEN